MKCFALVVGQSDNHDQTYWHVSQSKKLREKYFFQQSSEFSYLEL